MKVGFWYRKNLADRSRGSHRIDNESGKYLLNNGASFQTDLNLQRGLAFIAETLFLRRYRDLLLDKSLAEQGRKVDGYTEMIGFADPKDDFKRQYNSCNDGLIRLKGEFQSYINRLALLPDDESKYKRAIERCQRWRNSRQKNIN